MKTVRELTGLRTETSDTYLQSDGSRLLTIATHPINYKVGGKWQPIDDTLREANGRWSAAASPVSVSLPHAIGEGPVRIGAAGRELALQLQGASAPGEASGSQGTYRGAIAGVDVAYAASPQSLRETLTLDGASVPTTYRYALSLSPGLHASLDSSGGVLVKDAEGSVVYSLAAPTVSDARSRMPVSAPLHYELSPDGTVLSLVLDAKWLHDPARAFPVKVDPDVYFGAVKDCSLSSGIPTTSLCGGRLYVGYSEELKSVGRALLQFDLSSVPRGSQIISSSLAMWLESTSSASPIEIDAYGLSPHAFTSAATWNTYDGIHSWTTPGGDHLKTLAGTMNVKPEWTGGWVSWGFSPQVEQWVRDPETNYGILLKAHNETVNGYDTFYQTEPGEPAPEPDMHIVYEPQMGNPPNESMFQEALGNNSTLGVNVANGNLHITAPDVNYATEGYDTQIARSYNSLDDELVGSALGGGWRLNMGEDQLLYPAWWDGSNAFHEPDGSYTRFDRAPWADNHPESGDKVYIGDAYRPEKLIVHENGTRTLTNNETGVEWQFDNSENGFPQKIVDPSGEKNTITMSYTASRLTKVTDTHGHELTLARETGEPHRLTKIVGLGSGEEWKYTYTSGLLTEVTGPGGLQAKYTYGGPYSLLESVTDPSGTTVVTYDEDARVIGLRHIVNGTISAIGTEDEITTLTYEPEAGQTTVTHPDASTDVYGYDKFGNAAEDPGTQEAAEGFYGAYNKVEPGAAKEAIELQDHSAILDSQLTQQLGAQYTGEWFEGGKIRIGITSAGYEQTVAQDLADLGLLDNAEIVNSPVSWEGLETETEAREAELAELVSANLVRMGVQARTDAVLIETTDNLTAGQKAKVQEAKERSVHPEHVEIVERPLSSLAVRDDACSSGTCPPPLRGGVSIVGTTYETGFHETSTPYCTAGFVAEEPHGFSHYLITAGHCIAAGEGKGAGLGARWYSNEKEIGKGIAWVDAGANRGVSTHSEGDFGLIEINPSGAYKQPYEPWVIVYGNSEFKTTRNERYVIRGTKYNPHHEGSQENFTVCAGGAPAETEKAGESEIVRKINQVERCGVTKGFRNPGGKHNLEVFDACGTEGGFERGASGAPVYKHGYAYGVLSATGTLEPCETFYEGINTIEEVMHVRIRTG